MKSPESWSSRSLRWGFSRYLRIGAGLNGVIRGPEDVFHHLLRGDASGSHEQKMDAFFLVEAMRSAALAAGVRRIRPCLMTAATTIFNSGGSLAPRA